MRIAMNVGGEVVAAPLSPAAVVEQVCAAQAEGFTAAWTVNFPVGSTR